MIQLFRQFIPKRKLLLMASECFLLIAMVLVGTSLPGFSTQSLLEVSNLELLEGLLSAFTVAILCQISLSYNDLYDWRVSQNRLDLPNRLLHASGFSFLSLAVIVFLFPALFQFPGLPHLSGQTWKLVLILGFAFIALYYWRIGFHWFFYKWGFGERILLLGTGPHAKRLAEEIQNHPETGFELAGYLGEEASEADLGVPFLGGPCNLVEVSNANRVSRVIVAIEDRRGSLPVDELLACRLAGIRVEEHGSLLEKIHGKLNLESIRPSYLIFSDGFRKSRLELGAKRTMDILLSLTGLLLSLPLTLLVALAIRLESRGPILIRQERVGLDGREFTLFKFRSMYHDAEAETGPVWAVSLDSRITRVGRIIRAIRLDEIPQMWNILWGDMSFVGPRPERAYFVEQLRQKISYYAERLTVRPGLTGWAQIKYPYGASVEDATEKLAYDLYYIKNLSIFFDLSILFQTIKVILFRKGAR